MTDNDEKQTVDKPIPVTQSPIKTGPDVGKPVNLDQEDITPITRKKIQKVNSRDWENQTVSKLYDQLSTLRSRHAYAAQIGHHDMMKQLEAGIKRLEQVISSKRPTEETII